MSAFDNEELTGQELHDFMFGDKVCEAPLNESQVLKNLMTPMKAYRNEVEKLTD